MKTRALPACHPVTPWMCFFEPAVEMVYNPLLGSVDTKFVFAVDVCDYGKQLEPEQNEHSVWQSFITNLHANPNGTSRCTHNSCTHSVSCDALFICNYNARLQARQATSTTTRPSLDLLMSERATAITQHPMIPKTTKKLIVNVSFNSFWPFSAPTHKSPITRVQHQSAHNHLLQTVIRKREK